MKNPSGLCMCGERWPPARDGNRGQSRTWNFKPPRYGASGGAKKKTNIGVRVFSGYFPERRQSGSQKTKMATRKPTEKAKPLPYLAVSDGDEPEIEEEAPLPEVSGLPPETTFLLRRPGPAGLPATKTPKDREGYRAKRGNRAKGAPAPVPGGQKWLL